MKYSVSGMENHARYQKNKLTRAAYEKNRVLKTAVWQHIRFS